MSSKKNLTFVHTYQTRMAFGENSEKALAACAELMSRVERSLLAGYLSGVSLGSLKSAYLKKFGITARQFNACRVEIEGKIESCKALNKQRIADLQNLIQKLDKKRHNAEKYFFARRRLNRLKHKLQKLQEDQEKGIVRICFGTKKLFHKQFQEEIRRERWKKEWQEARNHSFFTLGSKDEAGGNQTCSAKEDKDGTLTLRLRLPDALREHYGKYLQFRGIYFSYGHQNIVSALAASAISYRFHKDWKGWRLFASVALPQPIWQSDSRLGVIGVDINVDHLAVVETDRFGNPICSKRIPLITYGKTQNQSLAEIGEAAVSLVNLACQTKKPLVLEHLDFGQKKRELKEHRSCSYKRMLSSFAYTRIITAIESRAYRHGIRVHQVNPAYSSLLGRFKFAKRYGLTTHQAAALCIGRRILGFSEKLCHQSYQVSDSRGAYVTFSVPARNRKTHAWAHLSKVSRLLQAALAEHFRVARIQSTGPPLVGV